MPQINRAIPRSGQPEPSSETLRPIFATYLNMARVNLYNVLRYISAQCGLRANTIEDRMLDMPVVHFAENKKDEVRERVKTLLFHHLPFLKQMVQAYVKKASSTGNKKTPDEPKADDVQFLLQHIIEIINFNRNYYTHADHYDTDNEIQKEISLEAELISPLNKCFTGSKRECKRIFMYPNENMHFVDGDRRMYNSGMKDEEGHPIYNEREDYYFRLNNADDRRLTTAGLVFLICKLIHKRYATQFVQKIGLFHTRHTRQETGYSPFNKEENKIMFDIFCAHRVRLPKSRVESTTTTTALGLDMLNELQKCPAELFETFSTADRKLFQVNRRNSNNAPEPDDDINLFRRYGDRFTQLALKFIDSYNADAEKRSQGPLPNIVFQVALGKYRHTFYNRTSFDGEERLRVLQKEINGFGPITQIEKLRKDENHYQNIIRAVSDNPKQLYDADTAQTLPYITDHHASYAITGERIGLMWNIGRDDRPLDEQTLCFLPTIPTDSDSQDDFKTNRKNGKIGNNLIPRAWLSVHDLPALIFLYLLGGKPGEIIKNYFNNITKLLSDIETGNLTPIITGQLKPEGKKRDKQIKDYREKLEKKLNDNYGGIKLSHLPDKLIEYLLYGKITTEQEAESNFNKWVRHRLEGDKNTIGMIQSLTNRIDKFKSDLTIVGSKQNRIGRKDFVDIRPGTLARYIAKDIMAMTTTDPSRKNNGKPSGLNFAILQSAIASYISYDTKLLRDTPLGQLLSKAINTDKHPFLNIVMKQKVYDTLDLYQKYLEAKLNYLSDDISLNGYNKDRDWFLREAYRNHVAKTENYMKGADGLAARYRNTLQLPNGLFDEAIREKLAELNNPEINNALNVLNKDGKPNGISYLIYVYFKSKYDDDSQPFYRNEGNRFKRHYKLFDELFSNGTETYLTDTAIAEKLRKGSDRENAVELIKKIDEEEECRKKMHQLHELQRNERDIRRHRNNDIILFLMAKKLLTDSEIFNKNETGGIDQFKLKNILPPAYTTSENTSLLEQPITFSLTFSLADENGKPITDQGVPIKRTVYQEGLKLKNYGDFYSFLYDTRIGSLLSQIPNQGNIRREELEQELDFYDRRRHEVFALLQDIERRIISENPSVQDGNARGEGFYYDKTVGNKTEKIAYRNNFYGLLSLCNRYLASENNSTEPELTEEGNMLVEIRNAFSHNRYVKSLTDPINISMLSLPEVARMIIEWLSHALDA